MKHCFWIIVLAITSTPVIAQTSPPARRGPIVSPEIHADRTVTFRVRAPNATNVVFSGEGMAAVPMEKDEQGIWTVTAGALEPNIYAYGFSIDGLRVPDLASPAVKPEPTPGTSLFEVPADKPQVFDFDPAVAHGAVRLHDYWSASLDKLRRMRVYTPPGYDGTHTKYPVVFLLHGSGDTEATWTEFGRAHFIFDNLLARKKMKPMVVVMLNGFASRNNSSATGDNRSGNLTAFEEDLLKDVIPFMEKSYRLKPGPENRAIIGLSMGGGQSLTIGLTHLDTFAWVGGMSASIPNRELALVEVLNDPQAANKKLKLLWFACGQKDNLLGGNQRLDEALTEHGIKHTFVATEGGHEWTTWRRHLETFMPLVFAEKR